MLAAVALFTFGGALLFSAGPTQAATFVQAAQGVKLATEADPTTVSTVFSSAVSSGHMLIAVVGANGNAAIAEPHGWDTAINQAGAISQAVFFKRAVGGEQSVSVTAASNPGSIGLHVYEYAGSLAYVGSSGAEGNSRAPFSGNVTTTEANELVFAAFTIGASRALTNPSWSNGSEGFVERQDFNTSGPGTAPDAAFAAGDNLANSPGLQGVVTAVSGAAVGWRGHIVRFQEDATPPAAIADLVAVNPAASVVELAWTAPGDDGVVGTAFSYDIRYALTPIVTETDFVVARQITGVPVPEVAGTRQTMSIEGLAPEATYYFAMKASDSSGNESARSNTAKIITMPGYQGGSGAILPTNIEIATDPELCTTTRNIAILVHAHNAHRVRISEDPEFSGSEWIPYYGDVLRVEAVPFVLSEGDGLKTAYVQFMSPFGLMSEPEVVAVRLDAADQCHSPHAHETIRTPDGEKIIAPGVEPQCRADYEHMSLEPYLINLQGGESGVEERPRVARLTDIETTYVFDQLSGRTDDDIVVHIERLNHRRYVHIEATGGYSHEIRVRVLADGAVIEDVRILRDTRVYERGQSIDLTAFPELCEASRVPHAHPGDVFRGTRTATAYYLDKERVRHVFLDAATVESWRLHDEIETVPEYQLAKLPLGLSIGYRPGTVVRMYGNDHAYLIDSGRRLRQILPGVQERALAEDWMTELPLLGDAYVSAYDWGSPIASLEQLWERQSSELERPFDEAIAEEVKR
ncbi:MAG: hypothetical protein QY323_03770 [Patescibacteria group bacterium]|nr:MAG: hypothetical protein QY323_03770 [Patescibacteria group bacterium]